MSPPTSPPTLTFTVETKGEFETLTLTPIDPDGHIWDRLYRKETGRQEPLMWYDRFTRFRLMGVARSVRQVYAEVRETRGKSKRFKNVPGAWNRAVEIWQWRQRAEAWDAYQRERMEERWHERRDTLQEQEWAMAQRLIERAELMLQWPLQETEVRREEIHDADGNLVEIHITVMAPAKWTPRDAAMMVKVASELGRLATGLDTGEPAGPPAPIIIMPITEPLPGRQYYPALIEAGVVVEATDDGGDAVGDDVAENRVKGHEDDENRSISPTATPG